MIQIIRRHWWLATLLVACVALIVFSTACRSRKRAAAQQGDVAEAAVATYVAPGDMDEFYLFSSGGHSGNVYVAGVPSMRHIATIPVFSPYAGTGYGFDKETKAMLGGYTWGDVHHPSISQTNGDYDGRWMFVNDNANNRVARIDLRDFSSQHAVVPENVLDAFITMTHSLEADGFSVAEFAADGYLALLLGFFGKQTRGHIAGVDQDERCVEQRGDLVHLSALLKIGNGMERSAERKTAFVTAGVKVDDHADLREDPGLDEIRDPVGDGAAWIAGKCAVHVDAVERRDASVGVAGALAQLRHENDAAGDFRRVEIVT